MTRAPEWVRNDGQYELPWCYPFLLTAAVLSCICLCELPWYLPKQLTSTFVPHLVRNGTKVARTYDVGVSELSNRGTTMQPL